MFDGIMTFDLIFMVYETVITNLLKIKINQSCIKGPLARTAQ
jgi:hypothetical protein